MYFSRVVIRDIKALVAEIQTQKNSIQTAYTQHQFLWKLFPSISIGNSDRAHFLFQHTPKFHAQSFLVLSQGLPVEHSAFEIQTKAYDPKINVGDRLEFSVTVNPVVTKQKKRNDVVADWKHVYKKNWEHEHPTQKFPGYPKSQSEIAADEGYQWLLKRTDTNGFEILQASATGYQQHQFYKSNSRSPIRISTLDLGGVLKVLDVEKFTRLLFEGLGPAKGFGCGLFLVKRRR